MVGVSSQPSEIVPFQTTNSVNMDNNSPFTITGHKLNGQNFIQWSQSVMMFICGKGKDDYQTGAVSKPKEDAAQYRIWKAENNMVMSWLINSMNNEIGENFLLYNTTQEIWEAVKEAYSHVENTSELFEIESVLNDLRQGESQVTQYFNSLNKFWLQLDKCDTIQWKCTEDSAKYKEIVEKKRLYKFLIGLNKNLDGVRGRILGTKPLPSLREAFAEVRREESRLKLMLKPSNSGLEHSALFTRGGSLSNPKQKKGRPWCDHCHKPGHTKDTCWDIHGKPLDWKPAHERKSNGNFTATEETTSASNSSLFSKEQMEWLQHNFGKTQLQGSTVAAGSIAHKGSDFGEDDWQC
ncbi:uncharacterized protein LOC127788605 [Diospyros lotus]|uniref:uncharacterized protein LOC127788605 n=1 Tax=Diospyros lotus TaxID=55363 RepID=UPI002258FDAB|nr:uncharacterized protein LOC127788605 [Diospyros lotus]